jgi:DNA-binding MarR family transcriptional regulator
MDNKQQRISKLSVSFSRVHNKLNRLERKAADFGMNEKLYAAELHTIAAIGNKKGHTVSDLCDLFGTTKGAVSQIISKLEQKHFVCKERSKVNAKEILISLTKKGWNIFNNHENLHKKMDKELIKYLETVPEEKIDEFIQFLSHLEQYIDHFS